MSVKFSLSKAGLEVYTTEPMEKKSDEKLDSKSIKEKAEEKAEENTKEDTQKTTTDPNVDPSTNFTLENGETKQIDYVGELYSDSYEMDYTEISSNSTVSVPIRYVNLFFKGKKVALKKAWQNGPLNWEHMETAVLGFVTEFTWNKDKADIKISGMDKLMEVDYTFEFTQTKRSEVVKQIIEASGLKAKVDATGLVDEVIDFKSSSSGDSGSSDTPGIGSAKIDDLVAKWCKGKTSDLEKAKAIHAGLRDEVGIWYAHYYNSRYHTPEKCLENHKHLNCGDTSILTVACMKSGGLEAYTALRCDSAHYFTVIVINGTKYYSDLVWSEGQRSQRPWNETWQNNKCGNKYDLK